MSSQMIIEIFFKNLHNNMIIVEEWLDWPPDAVNGLLEPGLISLEP